ncbi:MAG: hypothetical protein Q8N42_00590 [bacterium]|nr:hypothetical protein [bacterium]
MQIFKDKRFWITILSTIVFLALFFSPALGQEKKAALYFFHTDTCSHCVKEEQFLSNIEKEFLNLEIKKFEVGKNQNNLALMIKVGQELKIDVGSVPLTIIGKKVFTGYFDDKTSGKMIKEAVVDCFENACPDQIIKIIQEGTTPIEQPAEPKEKITLPFFGEVDPKTISLPLLSVVIGGLDGFNPCAMWILIFLISLLLGMKNRKRMWILGGAFIAVSAFVYFMFMTAWLNLFLFFGFVWWVRVGVGLVAIGGGFYYLKKYFTKKADVCAISEDVKKQKVLDKLKAVVEKKNFWFALVGIILLAGVVNLFELLCSAGFPAIFTKVLSMNELPVWQYYFYLLIYLFFFMLDDVVVFAIAMFTLQTVVFGKKYNRFSILIGGFFMLAIGFLLLFRPEWLSFKF